MSDQTKPANRTPAAAFAAGDSAHAGAANEELPLAHLIEVRSEIIDLMASGAPLSDTLTAIALAVERLAPPALCSILLLRADGKHLRPAAAPSLPEVYSRAIDGLEIGPDVGSCGTAAFTKEPVIVTDIATDPKWAGPRDFVLSFGLRACWSMPIIRDDGVVLGTIAMYYKEPRAPTPRDWGLLDPFARLVRLALAQARREEELSASNMRLQIAAEATGLGTYDADFLTGESEWSPRLRQILGVPADAASGLELFSACLLPDERQRFAERAKERSSATDTTYSDEFRIRRPSDGQERIITFRGRLLTDAAGTVSRAIGTIADITEQRHYEFDLASARDEAERANHAKSDFLASMSHELRTPLNAIIGFADVIRHCTMGPISPAKYREYVDDIHTSGLHLLSLINDVLDMAKIEAGKRVMQPEEISVAGVAAAALRLVEPQAKSGELHLDMQVDRDLMLIGDERAVTQILVNLLSNGVKFTKPGGRVIVFANRMPGGGASLGVEDSGIGMTPEGMQKAQEPFGQVEEKFTVEGRGTGLGLPLVKALLKAHGAAFKMESEPDKGTRAWGEFPPTSVIAARAVA